ncbi:MAG: response regulator transcription factor [Nocardiopsaceae bacterium]|nr:response regulator transcription factor [Nocardiopsaceae bacterium]
MSLRGENERAAAALREALAMRRELDDPMGIAYCLGGLGFVAARQGQYERSAWLTGAAAPVWRDLGTDAFAGMPALSALVAQAEADARRALGRDAWDEIFTAAATCPLATAVKLTVYDARLPATEVTRAPGTQAGAQGAQGATEAPAAGVTLTPGAGTAPGTTAPGTTALDETPLTSREQEIAGLVADGLSNREIANQLVISKRTVDSHVEHIFGKLGVSSRVQLMLWVRKHLGR